MSVEKRKPGRKSTRAVLNDSEGTVSSPSAVVRKFNFKNYARSQADLAAEMDEYGITSEQYEFPIKGRAKIRAHVKMAFYDFYRV